MKIYQELKKKSECKQWKYTNISRIKKKKSD